MRQRDAALIRSVFGRSSGILSRVATRLFNVRERVPAQHRIHALRTGKGMGHAHPSSNAGAIQPPSCQRHHYTAVWRGAEL